MLWAASLAIRRNSADNIDFQTTPRPFSRRRARSRPPRSPRRGAATRPQAVLSTPRLPTGRTKPSIFHRSLRHACPPRLPSNSGAFDAVGAAKRQPLSAAGFSRGRRDRGRWPSRDTGRSRCRCARNRHRGPTCRRLAEGRRADPRRLRPPRVSSRRRDWRRKA